MKYVVVYHAVRRTYINTTIFLQIGVSENYRGCFCVKYGARFQPSDSLISVLNKRYGHDLV